MWISGTLEADGRVYIYEIMLNERPGKLGIFGGRIAELHLYDENGQKIAEYDKQWVISPERGTTAYVLVGKILKEYNFEKRGFVTWRTDILSST